MAKGAGKKDEKKGAKAADLTPEEKMAMVEASLEAEKSNLAVELTFQKDKLKQVREENAALQALLSELKSKLGKQTVDSEDILTHKQREISQKVERVNGLEARVKELEGTLRDRDEQIRVLQTERRESRKKLDESAQMASEKAMLEEAVRRQDAVMSKQEEEIERMKKQLEEREARLQEAQKEIGDLTLKSSGTTKLSIIFGQPWLLTRSRHRLKGDVPMDREENTLNHMGSKLLVLYGGLVRGESGGGELCTANLDTMTWERASSAMGSNKQGLGSGRASHSATVVGKNKLVVFGGRRQALLNDVHVLNTDTMKFHTPAVKGSCPPRELHGSCAVREKIFVFGGSSNVLHSDLYSLDFETMQWTPTTTYGIAPSARRGHALCASDEGHKLWVIGGFDGSSCLNDVHVLETDRLTWLNPGTTGKAPSPREGHTAMVLSKYLFVAGGTDGHRRLSDVYVLDLEAMEWDCLSEGIEPAMAMVGWKARAAYCAFHGNKLITVKPNREEKLDEAEVIEFALPEDIEGLKRAHQSGDDEHSDRLELCDDAVTSANAIEVSWRSPAKNADRIDYYKLMMATNTGVVKEVCQGKYERFKVTGLRANAEYIFCVKALYVDGSHVWSESKAFSTRFTQTKA
mmetsp:Transcript_19854/g.64594  ORF Transcript_19854/g.64594 Transcript_19854/m.64594 type:complete len:632 (+) Transcript_19854:58-1953(+)